MELFDKIERTEIRSKRHNESTFGYLNTSARPALSQAREILQQWFDSYPESDKGNLRARLRSPIANAHKSAFWELYVHELFTALGFVLEAHPDLDESPNHPDFLATGLGATFYLEAVVAGLPVQKETAAEARLSDVFDAINKLQVPEWFLHLEYIGAPASQVPTNRLQKDLKAWLASLNREEAGALVEAYGFRRFEWQHEGLTLYVSASSRSTPTTAALPIGMLSGEAHEITTDESIRRALESKAKKYGSLPFPLMVAVNVMDEHCDDIDVYNALFGNETVVLSTASGNAEAVRGERLRNGVWFGRRGARNQDVSAVLVGNAIDIYNAGSETPLLIHHPYPNLPLTLNAYPLPEQVPDCASATMTKKDGVKACNYLRLPAVWPPLPD